MDHPFTPPSRIPSLPTPKKEQKKAETYFTIPQTSSAHLTNDELQQLTRSSLELTRPVFSRSHSRESRSGSRSSGYDRLYGRDGRSGSVSAIPVHTSSSAGLTGLELMQASYSSAALQHPQPYHKVSQYLTRGDLHLPPDSCAVSSNVSMNSGSPNGDPRGGLGGSTDGPSQPAPTSNPIGAQHLTGSDLHLPPDEISASVGHLIGAADLDLSAERRLTGADLHLPPDEIPASVTHLIGAELKLPGDHAPAIQSPYPVQPHTLDELEKSASVAALLLERMDTPSGSPHVAFLPLDHSLAPTPPPLPTRKESIEVVYQSFEIMTNTIVSYEAPTPPSVVALISNLGNQGDASSDPNWPLPARTPVYTFIPPPPSGSPIASSLEASIPSNIPSPVGSPITASQQQPMHSFIPPPRTLPTVVSELSATQQPAAYSMIPPPHNIATSVAPYNQPFSATPNSMAPSNQEYQLGFSAAETSMDPNNQPFVVRASHYEESAVAAPMPTSIAPYSQPRPSSAVQNPMLSDREETDAVTAARAAYVHPSGSRTSSSAPYNQPHIQESNPMPRSTGSFNQPSAMPSSMASNYRESSAVAATREAFDKPAQQSDGRVQMPGRFPTGDSVRTIVNKPSPSQQQPGSQPLANPPQYPVPQYQADPEAVAAARAAYVHPSRSRTSSTTPYNQPYQSASHAATMSVATYNQPSAMPSHMASHYRESSAVAAAKEAYDQPAGSMRNQMSQMHDQPAAMPSSMASHYRESSAVAKARVAYDEPSHTDAMRMSSNQSPSGLIGAITGFNNAFNRQNSAQKPVELSAFQNTQVQSPVARVPVPVHGSTPGTERNHLAKPPPVVVQDAGLAPQPVFRHSSQLNHDPDFRRNGTPNPQPPTQRLGLVPNQGLYHGQYQGQPQYAAQQHLGQAPPIDRQLPALAPSLHIEMVPSFPRGPPKEASFWRRRKKALIIMLVCVMLGIGVGIVFVAQSFYKRWGGVGFLGAPVEVTKREDVIIANRGHIGRRGFEHQKNGLEENRVGYLQAANGDILAHQAGSEGKKAGKGLLEGMLMAGYKRGWGTDFKDHETESSPVIPGKKVNHVQVIPVGSDARLTTPFAPDFEIGSTWWNARMTDMQKRGEEIIAAHTSPEDALKHAGILAQRFVDEIKARIEGNGLAGTCSGDSNGPSCPRCCRSESSDVDMAVALASDYVDRVPVDAANDYDLDLLVESMDTADMKRPAQEVAMLAAQGYIQRVHEEVSETAEAQKLDKRGVFSAKDIEKLNMGQDVPESVTVTVTKTRVSPSAATDLTPQDQAKQFATGYAEAVPHGDDGTSYLKSKRSPKVISWEALAASNAQQDVMPWADLRDAARAQIASACAGIHGQAQVRQHGELTKRARTAVEIAKHLMGKRDAEPGSSVMPWADLKDAERAVIASACASIHSKAGQTLGEVSEDSPDDTSHAQRSWSPYEVAKQMAGEHAKHVPDHVPASPVPPEESSAPLFKRLPNGVPKEPAELIAAAFLGALKHDDASITSESAKNNAQLHTRTVPKQGEVAGRSWSPYEVAKQMAGEYAKAVPAKEPLSKRHHGGGPTEEKRVWTPYEVAQQMAGKYAKAVPDHEPASAKEEVKEAPKEKRAWSPYEVAQQMAGEYARYTPNHDPFSKRAVKEELKEPAELLAAAFLGSRKSEEDAGRWSDDEFAKRKNVPFVTCGDHKKGCEVHEHPEICCPVLYTCHKSPVTNSGIICCPGNNDCSGSHTEVSAQAFCPPSTVACPSEASGGCCPSLDQCSPNGCLEFAPGLAPSNDPAKAHTETRDLTITTTVVYGMNGEVLVPESTTITVTEQVGGKVSVTATVAKDGELAREMSGLSAEETYSDGRVVKPGSFKSGGAKLWVDTKWWGGRRAMVWRLVGAAGLMSLM